MSTITDAVTVAAARISAETGDSDTPRVGACVRAREYTRTTSTGKRLAAALRIMWADIRGSWWAPASLPTISAAWAHRVPDRSRVPGDSPILWWGWVAWTHSVGLVAPVAGAALMGMVGTAVWVLSHPARFVGAVALTTPWIIYFM